MTDFTIDMGDRMRELLRRFKLPTFAEQIVRRFSDAGHDAALPTLLEVLEAEADERKQRRTVASSRCRACLRARRSTRSTVLACLEASLAKLDELATGAFLEHAKNVLCFGLPGRGKTHAASALGHALVRAATVLFSPTFRLVQDLLAAKRDLALLARSHDSTPSSS